MRVHELIGELMRLPAGAEVVVAEPERDQEGRIVGGGEGVRQVLAVGCPSGRAVVLTD